MAIGLGIFGTNSWSMSNVTVSSSRFRLFGWLGGCKHRFIIDFCPTESIRKRIDDLAKAGRFPRVLHLPFSSPVEHGISPPPR